MSTSDRLSAEQAAHAIILLNSNHATASDYLHSMDGADMAKPEFKEYLQTSSQEEYLELLKGHMPDECAELARKAAKVQKKRAEKGEPLAGWRPAKETAKQFFDILELEKTQGLHFKDVREAMKTIQISAPPAPTTSQSKPKDSAISGDSAEKSSAVNSIESARDVASTGEKEKAASSGTSSKDRKERRRKAFEQMEADKAKAKKLKAEEKKSRRAERRKLRPAGAQSVVAEGTNGTHSVGTPNGNQDKPSSSNAIAEAANGNSKPGKGPLPNSKKRKHETTTLAEESKEPLVPVPNAEPEVSKSKRRRQNRKERKAIQAARDGAPAEKPVTDADVITEQTSSIDGPTKKKQKTDHELSGQSVSDQTLPESTPTASLVQNVLTEGDVELQASSPVPESGQESGAAAKAASQRKRKKRRARSSLFKAQTAEGKAADDSVDDVEMTSPHASGTELSRVVSNSGGDNVDAQPMDATSESAYTAIPCRTMLPTLEPKVWKTASRSPSPPPRSPELSFADISYPKYDSSTPMPTEESPSRSPSVAQDAKDKDITQSLPNPSKSSASPAPISVEANGLRKGSDAPNSTVTAPQAASATTAVAESPLSSMGKPAVKPVKTRDIKSARLFSQSPAPSTSILYGATKSQGRASLGLGGLSLPFPSLGSVGTSHAKTNSIPSHASNQDPAAALKNLNKFLNNGNSSDESDSESSEDDSDDDHVLPASSKASNGVQKQNESAPKSTMPSQEPLREARTDANGEDVESSKDKVAAFKKFDNTGSRLSHEPSPSPEIPDLPALMDQGGYVPQPSSGDYTSSHVRSGLPTSDAANGTSSAMEIDLLSPFKNQDLVQGSAAGIVRPSEIVEYTSSPPLRGASITNELETDGMQFSLEQQSTIRVDYETEVIDATDSESSGSEYEMPLEQGEDLSMDDAPPVELERQVDEQRRSSAASVAYPQAEHDPDNDQAMVSSQLLGEANAVSTSRYNEEARIWHSGCRNQSPEVVIHTSPRNLAKTPQLSEKYSSDASNMSTDDDVEDEEAGEDTNDDEDNHDEDNKDRDDSSPDAESAAADDTGRNNNEESDSNSDDPDKPLHDIYSEPPSSPSSVEWDATKQGQVSDEETIAPPVAQESPAKKRKATGITSKHFSVSPEKKKSKRVTGASSVPFPKLSASRFGLLQEVMYQNPFQMLCAVIFLNKTSGHVAKEIIMQVLEQWPTPELLSKANPETLLAMIEKLGLQNERTKKLMRLAEIFVEDPPRKGRRHRTLNYPQAGDGKRTRDGKRSSPKQILEEDFDEIEGFLEIGHLYGAGPYAWDSWRIFCRDILRGVADGYNGEGVEGYNASDPHSQCTFEPEWKRVVPKDKELRACLRWMWLREGWDWDPLTGTKRPASVQKIREASQGIAEWNEPVPLDPHGVGLGELEQSPGNTGLDTLVPGIGEGKVLETTEKPPQSVHDGTPAGTPKTKRLTRMSYVRAQTGTASAGTSMTSTPRKSSEKLSPRSIRKLKAEYIAEYKASQMGASPSPFTQSRPAANSATQVNTPTRNTREQESPAVGSNVQSSPTKATSIQSAVRPRWAGLRSRGGDFGVEKTGSASENGRSCSIDTAVISYIISYTENEQRTEPETNEKHVQGSPFPLTPTEEHNFNFPIITEQTIPVVKEEHSVVIKEEPPIDPPKMEQFPTVKEEPVQTSITDVPFLTFTDTASYNLVSPTDVCDVKSVISADDDKNGKTRKKRVMRRQKIDKEHIVAEPKPGFFDSAYDEAWRRTHTKNHDPAYDTTAEEAEVKNWKRLARIRARDRGFRTIRAMEAADKDNGLDRDEILQGLKHAERAALAVQRQDPMWMWRGGWLHHYPQDWSYAVRATLDRDIHRSRPKQRDNEAWEGIKRVAQEEDWWSGINTAALDEGVKDETNKAGSKVDFAALSTPPPLRMSSPKFIWVKAKSEASNYGEQDTRTTWVFFKEQLDRLENAYYKHPYDRTQQIHTWRTQIHPPPRTPQECEQRRTQTDALIRTQIRAARAERRAEKVRRRKDREAQLRREFGEGYEFTYRDLKDYY